MLPGNRLCLSQESMDDCQQVVTNRRIMNTILNAQTDSSWEEADRLISILRGWGIGYLVGENHPVSPSEVARDQQSAVTLVKRLARCAYPRVRDASISLFLLHPELAPAVLEALETSEPEAAEQIAILTLATLYLQRLWSLRLTMALGHPPVFPNSLLLPCGAVATYHLQRIMMGNGDW